MINKALQAIVLVSSFCLAQTFTSCTKENSVTIVDDSAQSGKPPAPSETTAGRTFTVTPDATGWLYIDNKSGTYKPGDIIYLKGNFKGVSVTNLSGSAGKPISFRNARNTVTRVGNPAWNGGAGAAAMVFTNSRYIQVAGSKSPISLLMVPHRPTVRLTSTSIYPGCRITSSWRTSPSATVAWAS